MSVTVQLLSGEVYTLPIHSIKQKLAEILQQDVYLIVLFAHGKRVKEIVEGEHYQVLVRERKHYYLHSSWRSFSENHSAAFIRLYALRHGLSSLYDQNRNIVSRIAKGSIIHILKSEYEHTESAIEDIEELGINITSCSFVFDEE